jgi:hypothetical protein
MKKLFLSLAAAALSTLSFALDFATLEKSAGIGVYASPYFETAKVALDSDYSTRVFRTMHYGFVAYFDASYAQVALGLGRSSAVSATKVVDSLSVWDGSSDEVTGEGDVATYLALSLLFKYPFDMGGFYVFPAIGFEYDLNLLYTDAGGSDLKSSMSDDEKADLNMLWIKVGCGLDIPLSSRIYLRPEALAGFKLRSKLEKDWVDEWESQNMDTVYWRTLKVDVGFLVGLLL